MRSGRTAGHGRSVRFWPAALIVILAAFALSWIWAFYGVDRQSRILATLLTLIGTLALLLLWLLFGSRLRWRTRLIGFALVVLPLVLGGASLRIRGVSGDVVPILEWRWAAGSSAAPRAGAPSSPVVETTAQGARDYPQFLGPDRDGTVEDVRLDPDWSSRPPRLLWREATGTGWSGFAVRHEIAVTQEQWGPEECVVARALITGRMLWSHCVEARFEDPLGGPGPRATPSLHGDSVYALGATGLLQAFELGTGRPLWSRDVLADNGAGLPEYGVSASPLVFDDVVIVASGGTRGGSLAAYDRTTGEKRWAGGNDRAAYSSPMLVDLVGRRQVVVLTHDHVNGHDPAGGALLWSFPWPGQTQRVSQPVALTGDRLFVSTGYGVGGKLLAVESDAAGIPSARMIWESRSLKAKFTNVVHRAGYLFGLDDGILVSVDLDDGKRTWKRGRYGHGQLILVDDLLLIQAENGDIVLVRADPEEHREVARLSVLRSKTWNHPALAGRYLLVRNDREAVALKLPVL